MKLFKLLLVFSFLFICKTSMASHAMGADLTYTCLGEQPNGTWIYKLRYTLYRDCSGIPVSSTIDINYSSSCFPTLQTIYLNWLPSSPTRISPVCPTATTTCDVPAGFNIGIEEWVCEGTVTLPGPCADWTLYHSESARNAAITTTTPSGLNNLYVYSVINNTNNICNNSPIFSNRPVPIVCQTQNFLFNHGAYDTEGDSLSFQLITPRTGPLAGDTVDYNPAYSKTQPLNSWPPMSFNASTGEFFIVPQSPEVTVMAVLVNEWRNGILIGQIERDLQIIVINCNNNVPVMTGINNIPGPSAYVATLCQNESNCFFINSFDTDVADTVSVYWDNSIPGANVTISGGQRPVLNFCWTPDSTYLSGQPYCFTVTVSDNNCPYLGIQNYTYCLTVSNDVGCVPLVMGLPENATYDDILKIYPQPANNYFIAEIPEDRLNKNELIIQNTLGEIIGRYSVKETSNKIELPVSLTSGCYFVSLIGNGNEIISRSTIIINR